MTTKPDKNFSGMSLSNPTVPEQSPKPSPVRRGGWRAEQERAWLEEHRAEGRIRFTKKINPHDD